MRVRSRAHRAVAPRRRRAFPSDTGLPVRSIFPRREGRDKRCTRRLQAHPLARPRCSPRTENHGSRRPRQRVVVRLRARGCECRLRRKLALKPVILYKEGNTPGRLVTRERMTPQSMAVKRKRKKAASAASAAPKRKARKVTRKAAPRKKATRKKTTRKKATRKKATRKKATRKKATRKKAARKTTRKAATRRRKGARKATRRKKAAA